MAALIQLRLNKVYSFTGSYAELEEKIRAINKPVYSEYRDGRYRFKPVTSFGTLQMSGPFFKKVLSIYVDAYTIPQTENVQGVRLCTQVRVELYFISVMSLFFLAVAIFSLHNWQMALAAVAMFILTFLWFHMIYRAQENEVIKCIEAQLELEPV